MSDESLVTAFTAAWRQVYIQASHTHHNLHFIAFTVS